MDLDVEEYLISGGKEASTEMRRFLRPTKNFYFFSQLPKDLRKKLMTEYFDPISALRCLMVCTSFRYLLSESEIGKLQVGIVKEIAYEEQEEWMKTLTLQCELCGADLPGDGMARHGENTS